MFDELIAPLFTTGWGRRVAWGSMITLLGLVILCVMMMLYSWRQDYILVHTQPKQVAKLTQTDTAGKLIAQLPDQHIFGNRAAVDLPITSLQLRLIGVIKSEPEKFSRVIISEGGKPGKVYQVGDTLSGEVKINLITKDGVVLENGGRYEKLPLQRTPLQFQGMPKPLLPNDPSQKE